MTGEEKNKNFDDTHENATNILDEISDSEEGFITPPVSIMPELLSHKNRKGGRGELKKFIVNRFMEVRFKPNAPILDQRGSIAEKLSSDPFDSWTVSTNRVDFRNKKEKNINGYFSFMNFGMMLKHSEMGEEFKEKAAIFIKNAWRFLSKLSIIRIGMRSTYFSEITNFERALRKYKSCFLKLSENHLLKFGGDKK